MKYQFRPLGTWNGPSTSAGARKDSQFKATYPATLSLLFGEAEKLGARDLVLQVDIAERDIRTDGLPRANAKYGNHPGVVVSFESRFGLLRYATDVFSEWQANLRAIALALEALRAVDRYGVSKRGEQYTGWRALPAGNGSCFGSADEAEQWMRTYYGADRGDPEAAAVLPLGELHRHMRRMLHPDAGGGAADWDRLDNARQLLTVAGRL